MNHSFELEGLLKLKDNHSLLLSTREGSRIEFKENINFSNLGLYAKTMSGQANNNGGFIVFGIKDSPREVIGLLNNRFDEIDPVKITRFLNANFNPEIRWEIDTIDYAGKRIGYIYTYEADKKPIICTSNNGNELHESRIYYRYRGLTTDIKYPELRKMFDDLIEKERNMWLKNLEKIAKVGPENVMVMDLLNKEMVGKNKTYIIDESLIDRIKFIRSGSFNENDGEPTLKIIGDVVETEHITISKNIPISIDYDSLIISFLSQRSMSIDEAKAYLNEAFSQTSVYVPMFFYIKMSEIGVDEVSSVIEKSRFLSKHHISNIEKRLVNAVNINDFEFDYSGINLPDNESEAPQYISSLGSASLMKKGIICVFNKYPKVILENIDSFDTTKLLMAISELQINVIKNLKDSICKILLEIYMNEYQTLTSSEKTNFRKAISRVDDVLFSV
jgi:hypothetical protein